MKHDDTQIGGKQDAFAATHWSAIRAVHSDNIQERTRAADVLVAAYWKPVYKYIRIKWNISNEDAKDLTQSFFAIVLEKEFLATYDPDKGRFRTFLRVCLDRFLAKEYQHAQRQKRGGHISIVSIDVEEAEDQVSERLSETLPDSETMEEYFDKEWSRAIFSEAVIILKQTLEERGHHLHFSLFESYDLNNDEHRLSYDSLAVEHGIPVHQVTNYLYAARREFRNILLAKVRALTASETEYQSEIRSLLGIEPE